MNAGRKLSPKGRTELLGGEGDLTRTDAHLQGYEWVFRDQQWLVWPGSRVEAGANAPQQRHPLVKSGSSEVEEVEEVEGWSEPSSILVQLRQPQVAGELFLEEASESSVSLRWPRCASGEPHLASLDYWILCAEGDSSSHLDWQTVGLLHDQGEDGGQHLHYAVRFLRPELCYVFAVECRYGALPPALAAASAARLEAAALPSRLPSRPPPSARTNRLAFGGPTPEAPYEARGEACGEVPAIPDPSNLQPGFAPMQAEPLTLSQGKELWHADIGGTRALAR
ncbi:unnamed protein product [Symbiodinium natans]|uniref:Uncharacterized protein n=1 Tax=Symbiodinium natans TaxID=878477 RepID=A0A812K7I8_9DINO|nr:unnamed protein product [Symbiodinium natans]